MAEQTKVGPKELTIAIPEGALTSIQEQKRIRTDRFIRTYANSVAVGLTQWDVSLIFGEITGERDEDDKPVIEETVQIVLTREVVKALTGILVGQINAYEQQVGEIKLPAVLQPEKQTEKASESESHADHRPEYLEAAHKKDRQFNIRAKNEVEEPKQTASPLRSIKLEDDDD